MKPDDQRFSRTALSKAQKLFAIVCPNDEKALKLIQLSQVTLV